MPQRSVQSSSTSLYIFPPTFHYAFVGKQRNVFPPPSPRRRYTTTTTTTKHCVHSIRTEEAITIVVTTANVSDQLSPVPQKDARTDKKKRVITYASCKSYAIMTLLSVTFGRTVRDANVIRAMSLMRREKRVCVRRKRWQNSTFRTRFLLMGL